MVTVTVLEPGTRTSSPETVTVALVLTAVAVTLTASVPNGFSTISPAEIVMPFTFNSSRAVLLSTEGTVTTIT